MDSQFVKDIIAGLSSTPKTLPSKYFYDEVGDALFVKIMHSKDYYLTRAEFEIFSQLTDELVEALQLNGSHFDLVELGAGDGIKTIELLKGLRKHDFTYRPIDISSNTLKILKNRVQSELPDLAIETLEGEYFQALDSIKGKGQKVILFLGSNLGNMQDELATDFLNQLSEAMDLGDKILMGLDLKKSKDIILPAYNDRDGYTRDFNLNLLQRINEELEADFDLSQFEHTPEYDEENGIARSFLQSKTCQQVVLKKADRIIEMEAGEKIQTEVSRKYDEQILEKLLEGTNLKIKRFFFDCQKLFTDVLLEKQ